MRESKSPNPKSVRSRRFNQTYHVRAVKQGIIAEIARGYYRPAQPFRMLPLGSSERRLAGGRTDADPAQMVLNFEGPLFPEDDE